MKTKTYSEKLRDPKWQKKRLEVMKKDDFKCVDCGDRDTTLNVHHIFYEKDKEPWDYGIHDLRTLCWPCHQKRHKLEAPVKIAFSQLLARLDEHQMNSLNRSILEMLWMGTGDGNIAIRSE